MQVICNGYKTTRYISNEHTVALMENSDYLHPPILTNKCKIYVNFNVDTSLFFGR